MKKRFISSKITVSKIGRFRTASFQTKLKNSFSPTGSPLIITIQDNSIQKLIKRIEARFFVKLRAKELIVTYKLRKDEYIPEPPLKKEELEKICSLSHCFYEAFANIHGDPFCKPHYIQNIKTDPIKRVAEKKYRNSFCACGSGKKFKNCCALEDLRPARHYFDPKYKKPSRP